MNISSDGDVCVLFPISSVHGIKSSSAIFNFCYWHRWLCHFYLSREYRDNSEIDYGRTKTHFWNLSFFSCHSVQRVSVSKGRSSKTAARSYWQSSDQTCWQEWFYEQRYNKEHKEANCETLWIRCAHPLPCNLSRPLPYNLAQIRWMLAVQPLDKG